MRFFSLRQGFKVYFIEIQLVQCVLSLSCFRAFVIIPFVNHIYGNKENRRKSKQLIQDAGP